MFSETIYPEIINYKTLDVHKDSTENNKSEDENVSVFWSTEELPAGLVPKINLFKLLYRMLVTFH